MPDYYVGSRPAVNRTELPTAPRAACGPQVDLTLLPTKPPYTAFLGNLPYDVAEEDIVSFFRGIEVSFPK